MGATGRNIRDAVHVEAHKDQQVILLEGVPDAVGQAVAIAQVLASAGVSVDMIAQNLPTEGGANMGFSVAMENKVNDTALIKELNEFCDKVTLVRGVVKISLWGFLLQGVGSVLEAILRDLASNQVNIMMVSLSSTRLEFLVEESVGIEAITLIEKTTASEQRLDSIEDII